MTNEGGYCQISGVCIQQEFNGTFHKLSKLFLRFCSHSMSLMHANIPYRNFFTLMTKTKVVLHYICILKYRVKLEYHSLAQRKHRVKRGVAVCSGGQGKDWETPSCKMKQKVTTPQVKPYSLVMYAKRCKQHSLLLISYTTISLKKDHFESAQKISYISKYPPILTRERKNFTYLQAVCTPVAPLVQQWNLYRATKKWREERWIKDLRFNGQ